MPSMTGKQRIRAAMRHEPVDRVPVMCQLAIGHYLLNTRTRAGRFVVHQRGLCRGAGRRWPAATSSTACSSTCRAATPSGGGTSRRIETAADGGQTVLFVNGEHARCPADDNVQHVRARATAGRRSSEVDPARLYYDDPHDLGGLKYPFYFGLEPYRARPRPLLARLLVPHDRAGAGRGGRRAIRAWRDLLAVHAVHGAVRLSAGADVLARRAASGARPILAAYTRGRGGPRRAAGPPRAWTPC